MNAFASCFTAISEDEDADDGSAAAETDDEPDPGPAPVAEPAAFWWPLTSAAGVVLPAPQAGHLPPFPAVSSLIVQDWPH